jgi:hypothetical protein
LNGNQIFISKIWKDINFRYSYQIKDEIVTITPVKYIIYETNLKSFDILSTCFFSYILSNENLYPKLCELIKLCGRKLQFVFKVDYINLQKKQIPILDDNELINLFENDKNDKQISGKKNKNKKSKQTKKSITTNEKSKDDTSSETSIETFNSIDDTSRNTSISTDGKLQDDTSSETSIETFNSIDYTSSNTSISTDDTLSDDLSSETSNEIFNLSDETLTNNSITNDKKLQDDISSKIKFNIELKAIETNFILKLLNELYFDNFNFKTQIDKNDFLIITKGIHYDYHKHFHSKHFNGYFKNCDVKSSSYHFYIFKNKIYSITTINNLI